MRARALGRRRRHRRRRSAISRTVLVGLALVTALACSLFSASSISPASAAGLPPSGGGVIDNRGIAGYASGMEVHAGRARGANPCHWLSESEVAADPTLSSRLADGTQDSAWRQWGGNSAAGTSVERLRAGVAPDLLALVPLLKNCGGAVNWIVIGIFNVRGLALHFPDDLELNWLKRPTLTFEPKDPEFGWAYVQVPIDIRTTPVEWRTFEVTAENGAPDPYYQWVTVTAKPKEFRFSPGDGSPDVVCNGDAPIAAFAPDAPGACSVVFNHESSTAANGRSFAVRGEITWSVTFESSNGPGVLRNITLGTDGNIEVAAIKALVGCTGARLGQGGC